MQQASLGAGQRHTLEDPGSFPPSGPSRRQPPGTQLRPHRPAAPTDLVKLLLQGPALRDNGDLGLHQETLRCSLEVWLLGGAEASFPEGEWP